MKISTTVSVCILLMLVACDSPRMQDKQAHETPKALEDKSIVSEMKTIRGHDDLVESLYEELEDKSPELKDLESRIERLSKTQPDSTESFDKYNDKIISFYNSAGSHTSLIVDSVLRERMKKLIANSLSNYTSSTSKQHNILKWIEKNNLTLNDLHIVLKITRTLPIIEKYQHDDVPSSKSMESFSKQLEQTVIYLDTLTKK